MNVKKNILYFTMNFPYAAGEENFALPEILSLAKEYNLTIVCYGEPKKDPRPEYVKLLPSNVHYCQYVRKKVSVPMKLFSTFSFFLNPLCGKEFIEIVKGKRLIIPRMQRSLSYYLSAKLLYKWLVSNRIIESDIALYYTYWYTFPIMSILLTKGKSCDVKIVSRAHGFDLYNERTGIALRQPFRSIIDPFLSRVLFISDQGKLYYEKCIGKKSNEKYKVLRIGAPPAGLDIDRIIDLREEITSRKVIVSCSNIISIKRVELIVKALSLIREDILHWVHFGDGELRENVEKLANELLEKKDNITYEFKGYVARKEIYQYYYEIRPSLFITVSASEGSPVSIQEALAFGMPIVGTDVGGVKELIARNGVLIRKDSDEEDVRDAIISVLHSKRQKEMCTESWTLWNEKYNLEKNMQEFKKEIDLLVKP